MADEIKIRLVIDREQLQRDVDTAAKKAEKDSNVKIKVSLDQGSMNNAVNGAGALDSSFARLTASMTIAQVAANVFIGTVKLVGNQMIQGARDALQFEKSIAQINTVLDDSEQLGSNAANQFREFSATFGTSSQKQAEAYNDIVQSGIQGTVRRLDLLTASNEAAVAGFADLSQVTKLLSTSTTAYSKQGLSAAEASDVLFAAVRDGVITIDQFAHSLGTVTPLGQAAGVSFSDLAGTIAFTTKSGIQADTAIVGLRQILSSVIAPTKEAAEKAKNLGLQFNVAAIKSKGFLEFLLDVTNKTKGNSQDLSKLFGDIRALVPILNIASGNTKDFAEVLKRSAQSAGSASRAFNIVADSADFKLDQLISDFKSLRQELAENFIPIVDPVVDKLRGLLALIREARDTKDAFNSQGASLAQVDTELSKVLDKQQVYMSQIAELQKLGRRNDLSVSIDSIGTLKTKLAALEEQERKLFEQRKVLTKERIENGKKETNNKINNDNAEILSEKTKLQRLQEIGFSTTEMIAEQERVRLAIINQAQLDGLISLQSAEQAKIAARMQSQQQLDLIMEQSLGEANLMLDGFGKAWEIAGRRAKQTMVSLAQVMQSTIVNGIGNAFSKLGEDLAKGNASLNKFANYIYGTMGDIASVMGDYYIKLGIARIAAYDPGGPATVAAGAALKVLGGFISAKSGMALGDLNTSPASSVSGAGGGSQLSADRGDGTRVLTDSVQQRQPDTKLQLVIQGDILDSQETGTRIAKILSDSFGKEGVVLTDARFA